MNNPPTKILLVDDEKDILEFLSYNLKKEGYSIETANNGEEAILKAHDFLPDLILLDVMMPEMNGIEVCQALRKDKRFESTLIAFLTARSESFTEISALDSGGDDFINKPIKTTVLKSRLNALLRRGGKLSANNENTNQIIEVGDLKIDLEKMEVHSNGSEINLAKKEFELLSLMVSKPGKVFKRAEIMAEVWGYEVIVGDRTIDVHIRKLREKLGSDYIQTYKGVGYKFKY